MFIFSIIVNDQSVIFDFYLIDSLLILWPNHYHILIRTPEPNLDKAMHYFGSNFSRQINRDLHADGPLFKDRYKSLLVDTESYLLQVSRYIHLNPVESHMTSFPEEYAWSSYRSYLESHTHSFLKKDPILSFFNHQ